MASNCTENYGLCQWEATDAVLRTDFNEDNQKIDTELKTQAGNISDLTAQMANKANTGAVNSLAEEVAQKADQSDLEAAVSRVTTLENKHSSDVAALRSENCWVKLGEKTLSGSLATYFFSVENPEQYSELKCIYSVISTNGSVNLSINDGALIYQTSAARGVEEISLIVGTSKGIGGRLNLFSAGTGHTALESKAMGFDDDNVFAIASGHFGLLDVGLDQIQTITFSTEQGAFQKGGYFLLYGLKK